MAEIIGTSIVFEEGDPPSEVYPTQGTIIGSLSDEHGDAWYIVHFDGCNGYTLHSEERVLVRPRRRGREMTAGARIDLLTKRLPLGSATTGLTAISEYPFGPWVTAIIRCG